MSRPLLIAVLTVAAVAWPAAAQGVPLGGAPDLSAPPALLNGVDVPLLDEADPTTTAASCRPYDWSWNNSQGPIPEFTVKADPDGCINRIIDDVWPFWLRAVWIDPEGDGFDLL